ncbi:MAG TPA: oxidoreductase [Candidatus Acidoferrum sp.]|nr:oxidoreductase [Candidatus Acidoferrum sp.]
MIDVGLIGFGLAGRAFHAPVIRATPGLRLAAILQRSGNEAAERYPDVRIVRSVEELLAIPDIRLVVIATPNETHAPLARQCLEAGRDVLVDKPFATTLKKAAGLVALARERGRLITVYQNRRYDGDFHAIRQVVADGTLGRIVRFETNYDRYRPELKPGAWRERVAPGSGILFDIAPHLIDHTLVLFGLPEAVTADVRVERPAAVVDDSFDVMLHYPAGMRAVLRSTMLAVAPRPRFVLHGTRGSFFKQTFDPQEINLRRGIIPERGPWGGEPEEDWGVLATVENDVVTKRSVASANSDYRDYYANVRDAMLGRAALAVTPEHALDVMRVLEMAQESSKTRCPIAWYSCV